MTDEECMWDYPRAQCKNPEVCSHQYVFLDTTFDQSCRLKIRPAVPVSDNDCLWDAAKVSCADPHFCTRQCMPGDLSLHQCCRLRVSRAKPARRESADVDHFDAGGPPDDPDAGGPDVEAALP